MSYLSKNVFMWCCGRIGKLIAFNFLVLSLSPNVSVAIAVELAIICNFIFNNRFSFSSNKLLFKVQRSRFLKKMLQFNLTSFFSLMLQVTVMHLGVHYWGHGFIVYNALLLTGALIGSVCNYFLYNKIIWNEQK